jgi:hypothetical protein
MNNNPYPNQQPPSGPYPSNPGYPSQGQPGPGPYTQYPPQQPGYPPPGYPQGQPPYPQQPSPYPQGQPPYPQQQPPVPQPPAKKKPGIFKIGCGAIVAVIVLIGIISAVSNGGKSSSTATPSSPDNSSNNTNSTNNSAPSKPTTWTTTHTYTGNGIKKTETFSVGDDWKLQWSCDPTSSYGGQYNVIVGVYNSDGTPADIAAINTICKAGNTSGETEERSGGNVYLDVNSEAAWTLTIQEPK